MLWPNTQKHDEQIKTGQAHHTTIRSERMSMTNKELIKYARQFPEGLASSEALGMLANALESADATLEKAREIVRKAKRTIDKMGSWDQSEWEWEQLAKLLGMEDE